MRNRIAVKLMLYFTSLMLVFALIIGGVFYQSFKQHTVEIKKRSLAVQAQRIAAVISENLDDLEQRYGEGFADSRFISYLDNVSQDIVWVVDRDYNLSINKNRIRPPRQQGQEQPPEAEGRRPERRRPPGNPPPRPRDAKEAYKLLPEHVKGMVERCFQGERFIEEEYNEMLDGIMLTVGQPVYDKQGQIKAVVLLHSPVQGLRDAIWAGLRILFFSVLAALALGVVLSIILSWRFTRPLNIMKNNAERLAEREYDVRNKIEQHDEVGELARTLDVLAERLEIADAESQKLEKLRREFIANISHELRTPVTVIRGSLEALRDGVVTEPAEVQDFHEQMYNESIFLQRLINDLLDLSRLQNTDFPIEKAPLNFCDVVQDAVRGSKRLGIEKNLQISAELDTDLYMVNGDYGRLRQMLMIFLHNSIKFSPEGSAVLVKLEGSRLFVCDHGCGIKAEDVPHAFERFYKARNEHNKSGSGLGLAIAKQIALRHDMQLELASEYGKGTTITVLLCEPLAQEQMEVQDNEQR